MTTSTKAVALVVSSAFLLTIGAASVSAAENPFAIKSLSSGYQVADNHADKAKDGKCGEGKCGDSNQARQRANHMNKCQYTPFTTNRHESVQDRKNGEQPDHGT